MLTSLECLRELEEKQRRKQEKEDMKEKRKKDREEKWREKERLAKEKQEKKEKKRKEKEAIEQRSACEAKKCGHSSATRWIQCDSCNGWFHCLCSGVKLKDAHACEFNCAACT